MAKDAQKASNEKQVISVTNKTAGLLVIAGIKVQSGESVDFSGNHAETLERFRKQGSIKINN